MPPSGGIHVKKFRLKAVLQTLLLTAHSQLLTDFMRILIVKLGSIGDIVHTLPALAAMHRALPDSEISWVVERRASEILKDNPLLDRLIEVDTKALRRGLMSGETLRALRQQLRLLCASGFCFFLRNPCLIRAVPNLSAAAQSN